MKVSDYIVSFLSEKGVTDVFGYPGGMVTHLMDSFHKYCGRITAHVSYHEQGAAFAACGYAQTSGKWGVAYATSGPGATNLITGICNAYFDSIPTLFITGQVNTYESAAGLSVRQKGFQETDVVNMLKGVTKYCVTVKDPAEIRYHLEKAFYLSFDGRPGPVVLDIPMNVQRGDIDVEAVKGFDIPHDEADIDTAAGRIAAALQSAERPCVIAGAGIRGSGVQNDFERWINRIEAPVVSSMPAVDVLPESPYYFGFAGAYGCRAANFILTKADLIISLGSRLDIRQTGGDKSVFAPNARIVRVDIDEDELTNKIKDDEIQLVADLKELMPALAQGKGAFQYKDWLNVCEEIGKKLDGIDDQPVNSLIAAMSGLIPYDAVVTTDVGQNQVWVAQSFIPKGQRILFSGGHGAMGYSLPAAIGAHFGCGRNVYSFNGDGGFQMNIQELQFIARERLPIKIILFNNKSLGMIRHFQEMYFNSCYYQTKKDTGYTVPDFQALANAYGLPHCKIRDIAGLDGAREFFTNDKPTLIEIDMDDTTYVYPKLAINKPSYDQEPEIDKVLIEYLMNL